MDDRTEKTTLLKRKGFAYSFDREVYFNRNTRKVFSVEFVEDHTSEKIRRLIGEHNKGYDWRFYFNEPPSNSVRQEIKRALG